MSGKVQFLKLLKQKLTTGNRRSIHLNALPGRSVTRLDTGDLKVLHPEMDKKFLDTLLNQGHFNFKLSYNNPENHISNLHEDEQKLLSMLSKRLNTLTYENNDNYLETGVKPFGFGYPLLIKKDRQNPSKTIKAPLIIWRLDIEKSNKRALQWNIKRAMDYPVFLNQVLVSHIENDEGIQLRDIPEEYLDDDVIDANEVVDICNHLLEQLGADEEYPTATITDCPGRDTLDNMDLKKPYIRWSGVFGIFKTQKQSIIRDIDALIKLEDEPVDFSDTTVKQDVSGATAVLDESLEAFNLEQEKELPVLSYQKTTFAAVKTDPSQQGIIHNIGRFPKQIIQGPPGTGKSQSLTAIITNALENKAKCLVVCEKNTALEVIQNNLSELGLGDLSIIIEDIIKDRTKTVNSIRNRLDNKKPDVYLDDLYLQTLEQAKRVMNKSIAGHRFLARPLLDKDNWTNMVGRFLQTKEKADYKTIDNDLWSNQFDFNTQEYREIIDAIKRGYVLFERIGKIKNHPLDVINHKLYLQDKPGEILFNLEKIIRLLIDENTIIFKHLQTFKNDYEIALKNHYQQYANQSLQSGRDLEKLISENITNHKDRFNHRKGVKNVWLKMWSFALPKFLDIRSQQDKALRLYDELKQLHEDNNYFEHQFLHIDKTEPLTFREILENVQKFLSSNKSWQQQHIALIHQRTSDLTIEKMDKHIDKAGVLQNIQNQYSELVRKTNETDLLNVHIVENTDNLQEQIVSTELLKDNLEDIQNNLKEFKDFYAWKNFYLNLNSKQKMVLNALIKNELTNWQDVFEAWYYNYLLSRNETDDTPSDDLAVNDLYRYLGEIRKLQPDKIMHNWETIQQRSVRAFNRKFKSEQVSVQRLYNKRGSKGQRRNSLRKIIDTDFTLFTDFFPVLLVNPIVCSSIIPLQKDLFDVVIFDEASQLRLEDTYCALMRGKNKIVSGDIHQMPPSNYFGMGRLNFNTSGELINEDDEESDVFDDATDLAIKQSLLVYAEDLGYERSFLDFHYRSRHPYLIDFSNAAFYGSRLVPMPARREYKPIRFFKVPDAIYDKSTNPKEADKVIEILLTQIKALPDGRFPSVGVATFNILQRNLILEKLQAFVYETLEEDVLKKLEAYQLSAEEAAIQINQLFVNGLFIKNLENIQGDERDIIIISTTFGPREDGRFTQLFGPINMKSKGYKLLNVIITRAKHQLYVCTSIPESYYLKYEQEITEKGLSGRNCLYAYLTYAQAIEQEQEELRLSILQILSKYGIELNSSENVTQQTSPFIDYIAKKMKSSLPQANIHTYYKMGGFLIDIVVEIKNVQEDAKKETKLIAIDCDGSKAHNSDESYVYDYYRREQLEAMGFRFYRTYSVNWWMNEEKELERLMEFVEDRNFKM